MTCIDKLRELHPEWDEAWIRETVHCQCPSTFNLNSDPDRCPKKTKRFTISEFCPECWEREYVEPIPHEFEYLDTRVASKVHATTIERSPHYYTRETLFRVRLDYAGGGVWEGWLPEKRIRSLLSARIMKEGSDERGQVLL